MDKIASVFDSFGSSCIKRLVMDSTRSVFRTLSNIYNGAFLKAVSYLQKKVSS